MVLFILGLVASGLFSRSIYRDFRYVNEPVATPVTINNPHVDKLDIDLVRKTAFFDVERNWIWNGFFLRFDQRENNPSVNNTRLVIRSADTDSFRVSVIRLSNGASLEDAANRAAAIPLKPIVQNGGRLSVPCDIAINKSNKFRNQNVIVTVYVPVGKKIEVHTNRRAFGRFYFRGVSGGVTMLDDDNFDEVFDEPDYPWKYDREYIMTTNGLELTEPDLEIRKQRIQSSEQIIEKEKNKIKKEQENIRKNLEEERKKIEKQMQEQERTLKEKAKSLEELSKQKPSISLLDPVPTRWIGKALLRFS